MLIPSEQKHPRASDVKREAYLSIITLYQDDLTSSVCSLFYSGLHLGLNIRLYYSVVSFCQFFVNVIYEKCFVTYVYAANQQTTLLEFVTQSVVNRDRKFCQTMYICHGKERKSTLCQRRNFAHTRGFAKWITMQSRFWVRKLSPTSLFPTTKTMIYIPLTNPLQRVSRMVEVFASQLPTRSQNTSFIRTTMDSSEVQLPRLNHLFIYLFRTQDGNHASFGYFCCIRSCYTG